MGATRITTVAHKLSRRRPDAEMRSAETKQVFAPVTEPSSRPLLRIESLTKRFGRSAVVDQLSLDIYEGEVFALVGPSGCGKATLLRLIAGFRRGKDGR